MDGMELPKFVPLDQLPNCSERMHQRTLCTNRKECGTPQSKINCKPKPKSNSSPMAQVVPSVVASHHFSGHSIEVWMKGHATLYDVVGSVKRHEE
ncbi:MAG: hypothetical protein ACRD52_12875, partial [Candidatus Acidiferrales bacterium]